MYKLIFRKIIYWVNFRNLIGQNRCVCAVEGYYEWQQIGKIKQPYYISSKQAELVYLAAIYDLWQSVSGLSFPFILDD